MKHLALIISYWIVLLGLMGEFSTPAGQKNPTLPVLFLVWIVFGIWRVMHKLRLRHKDASAV